MGENLPRMIVFMWIVNVCLCAYVIYIDLRIQRLEIAPSVIDDISRETTPLPSFPIHKGPAHYCITHDNGKLLYDGHDSSLAIAAWETVVHDHTPIESGISWLENGVLRDRREQSE